MQEMCCRSLDLKFKAKLKLESGNQKIQNGHQAAILKVTYLKINRLPHTLVMCYWSLDLLFKAKQNVEFGNRKIQNGRQAAILKVTSLKINRLLPMATNNMHMKFQIEIPKQTWVTLRKPCRLQTDGQTDGRTGRQTDKVIPVYPQPTSLGGGIKIRWLDRSLSQICLWYFNLIQSFIFCVIRKVLIISKKFMWVNEIKLTVHKQFFNYS